VSSDTGVIIMNTIPSYLDCSTEYRKATEAERKASCNGCGSGKARIDLVPDSMWGLDVEPVCCIHDWDYKHGKTEQDKIDADFRMLRNLIAHINAAPGFINKLLRLFRRRRALKYYEAVQAFGHDAYWQGKERPAA
jgi:hypothetical protein